VLEPQGMLTAIVGVVLEVFGTFWRSLWVGFNSFSSATVTAFLAAVLVTGLG